MEVPSKLRFLYDEITGRLESGNQGGQLNLLTGS